MIDFWNKRYDHEKYAYGKEPNVFLKETITKLPHSGRALFPGEGEGRNAVFAAEIGFDSYAFDLSEEGQKKAIKLAKERSVTIDYQVGAFPNIPLAPLSFDVIGLIFAHFPPVILADFHRRFVEMLNPGGHLILEGFSKNNLKYLKENPYIGGPKDEALLFSTDQIEGSFTGLETLQLEEKVIELNEGKFHQGTASVVRYIGKK